MKNILYLINIRFQECSGIAIICLLSRTFFCALVVAFESMLCKGERIINVSNHIEYAGTSLN